MAEFEERKHPRDNDGKFTSGADNSNNDLDYKLFERGYTHKEVAEMSKDDKNSILKNKDNNKSKLSNDVDDILNGQYKDSHITILEETPKIFQDIGIPNKPMLITAKHTYLVINEQGKYSGNYHGLGKETFLDIPALLQSPILAFQSKDNKNDIISIINAIDKNGKPVIVPIHINGKGNRNYIEIDANIIKSAYGKDNIDTFLEKNLTEDNLLFIENKKIRNLPK